MEVGGGLRDVAQGRHLELVPILLVLGDVEAAVVRLGQLPAALLEVVPHQAHALVAVAAEQRPVVAGRAAGAHEEAQARLLFVRQRALITANEGGESSLIWEAAGNVHMLAGDWSADELLDLVNG